MARRLPALGEMRLLELEAAWKSERRNWARQRLRVMRMLARHKHGAQEISEALGVGRATVFNYLRSFLKGGVAGLLHRGYGIGRPGVIDEVVRGELVEKLQSGEFARAKDAQCWLRERTGRTLSLNTLYYHLGICRRSLAGAARGPRAKG